MTEKQEPTKPSDEDKVVTENLYVVQTKPLVARDQILEALPEHLEYQVMLEQRGIMFAAGPLFDKDAETHSRGLIVIRAQSFEEADKIAAADPMHAHGLRSYTIDRWRINEGAITLQVRFADRSVSLD